MQLRKKGASVRLDCSLVGFKSMQWKRGSISFVFRGSRNRDELRLFAIDHINGIYGDMLAEVLRELHRKEEIPARFRKSENSTTGNMKEGDSLEKKAEEKDGVEVHTWLEDGEAKQSESKEGTSCLEDEHKEVKDADDGMEHTEETDAEDEVDAMLSQSFPVTHLWSREAKFSKATSFWTGQEKTKTVGSFAGTVYSMKNLHVSINSRFRLKISPLAHAYD